MSNLPRSLLILAAALALIASIFILSSRGLVTETTVYEDGAQETTVIRQSWYQTQGTWGVAILIIFSTLYYAPYHFYARDRILVSALFALASIILTCLAGFSIGGFYLPAAGAFVLAYISLGIARSRQP